MVLVTSRTDVATPLLWFIWGAAARIWWFRFAVPFTTSSAPSVDITASRCVWCIQDSLRNKSTGCCRCSGVNWTLLKSQNMQVIYCVTVSGTATHFHWLQLHTVIHGGGWSLNYANKHFMDLYASIPIRMGDALCLGVFRLFVRPWMWYFVNCSAICNSCALVDNDEHRSSRSRSYQLPKNGKKIRIWSYFVTREHWIMIAWIDLDVLLVVLQ